MSSARSVASPLWLYPNLLGLDAPVVAVVWQWLFAKSFGINFPPIFHLILGLSAWCIYLADRIYDASSGMNPENGTDRMRFTSRHLRILLLVLVVATVVNVLLIVSHVPLHLIVSGLATASLLAVYYLIRLKCTSRIKSIIPREILCGMLFSLGCAITPHAYDTANRHPLAFWIAVGSFGIVCSAACILISLWERDEDLAMNDNSIATDHSKTGKSMALALPTLMLLCIPAAIFGNWHIYASVALSVLCLFLMLRFQEHLSKPQLRVLADAVLLSPLIFIWF
ncbi:MAG: UbiA family prenyltransferase [Luteolibacter sp.]